MSDIFKPRADLFKRKPTGPQFFSPDSPRIKPTLESRIRVEEAALRRQGIEVPDGDKKHRFALWDILEWARYPITNMLYTAAKESKADGLGWDDLDKVLKSAVRGVLLQEKRNSKEVIEELWPDIPEWSKSVLGLAGDILTDPATYLTFGYAGGAKAAAKAGTVAKAFGRGTAKKIVSQGIEGVLAKKLMAKYGGKTWKDALRTASRQVKLKAGDYGPMVGIPFTSIGKRFGPQKGRLDIMTDIGKALGVGEVGQRAMRALPERLRQMPMIGAGIRGMEEAFSTAAKWGPFKSAKDIDLGHANKVAFHIDNLTDDFAKVTGEIDNILRTPNITIPGIEKFKTLVHRQHHVLEHVAKLMDEGASVPVELKSVKDLINGLMKGQFNHLVKRGMLTREQFIKDYIPRYYENAKGQKGIVKVFKGSSHAAFMERRVFNTVEEAIEAGYKPLPVAESIKTYLEKSTRKMGLYDMTKDMVETFGRKLTEGEVFADTVDIKKIMVQPFLDWIAPTDIAKVLNEMEVLVMEPAVLSRIAEQFTRANNFFKKTVTVIQPGFHGRNFMSGIWTMILKDGKIGNLRHAHKIYTGKGKTEILELIMEGRSVKKTLNEWWEITRRHGVNTGKSMQAEIIKQAGRGLGKDIPLVQTAKKYSPWKAVTKLGTKAGSWVENTGRIASWLTDLEKGLDYGSAARRVKNFFLDYSDLTPTEQKIRQLIPFYTWLKKNFVLQMQQMLAYPGRYSMISSKPVRALDQMSEQFREYLPDWMNEQMMVQVGETGGVPLMYNPNFPFQDLGKITDPLGAITGGITPLAKTPIELLMNKDVFTGRPIAYNELDTTRVPAFADPLIGALPAGLKRAWNVVRNEEGRWEMPAKWVYALTHILPIARTGQAMFQLAGLEGGKEYEKRKAPFQALSGLIGAKFVPADMKYYREKYLQQRLQSLRTRRKQAEKYIAQ